MEGAKVVIEFTPAELKRIYNKAHEYQHKTGDQYSVKQICARLIEKWTLDFDKDLDEVIDDKISDFMNYQINQ